MNRLLSLAVLGILGIPLASPQISQAAPYPVGVQVQVGPANFGVQAGVPCATPTVVTTPVVTSNVFAPPVIATTPVVVTPAPILVGRPYWDGHRWVSYREWALHHPVHYRHYEHRR